MKLKLVNLQAYRTKEVVEALEALLVAAREGAIEGFVYVVQSTCEDHRAGMAGVYRRHPERALGATFELERLLSRTGPHAERM